MSMSDRRIDRRQSSGSLEADSSSQQSSPRTSSLPPTPPSASDALHSALPGPSQPFLPPLSPLDFSTKVPLQRARSFTSRLGDGSGSSTNAATTTVSGDEEGELLIEATTSVPDPIEELLEADMPPLPTPRSPSSCPIFCCFYAEFDIVKGPVVAFQSPKGFMGHDTGISTEEIHDLLEETFQRIEVENKGKETGDRETIVIEQPEVKAKEGKAEDDSQEPLLSIFDATSEYIITGNELAGKMINLSTHNMHILTRPTAIADERYERNALLFSVGFVLSRKEDPRPFRPLLCKWADALRSMEVENQFLTNPKLRVKLQPMLDRLLVSLNSAQCECNLLLDAANSLNLRAFRPPKPPIPPVPDHAVPILVREDLLHLYDWDLAIPWISKFISGVDHARWIAIKSDVDMEMVRACLRVLKHHGVIALADMFFYSNRYECTERASAMLAGKEPKLLQEAMYYVQKLHQPSNNSTPPPPPPLGETAPGLMIPALSSSIGKHSDGMPFLPIKEDAMSFPPRKTSIAGHHVGSLPSAAGEVPRSQASRQLQKKLKMALAELYCLCNRNISFGELIVSKIASSSSNASMTRRGNSRASSVSGSVDLDGVQESWGEDRVVRLSSADSESLGKKMFSPSESSVSEKAKKGIESSAIDWKEVFEFFDHRRFATFGVVHGLLRRVHNFPRAIETGDQNVLHGESTKDQSTKRETDTQEGHRRTSFRTAETQKSSVATTPTAARIATKMDGTKCDDELVCEFEKPVDDLIELVEASGRRKVMSIYSTGSET